MKKFLNTLFNVFWVLLVGLVSAMSNALLGALCCVTIVGIPLGLQYFKFVKLIFAPEGKVVVTKYSRHPVMNTFWIVFGGFIAVTIYFFLALLLCVTVVGIPLAKQLFKIMKFMCAPFGSEILKEGEYSKDKNLTYDMKLLNRHICVNPEAAVEYIRSKNEEIEKLKARKRGLDGVFNKGVRPLLLVGGIVGYWIRWMTKTGGASGFRDVIELLVPIIVIVLVVAYGLKLFKYLVVYREMDWTFCKKHISALIAQYPDDSPIAPTKYKKFEKMLNVIGLTCRADDWKLLYRHICVNPDVQIVMQDGTTSTVREYLNGRRNELTDYMRVKYYRERRIILLACISPFTVVYVALPVLLIVFFSSAKKWKREVHDKYLQCLLPYYPVGIPVPHKGTPSITEVFKSAGLIWTKEELKEEIRKAKQSKRK